MNIKHSRPDKIFNAINYTLLALFVIILIYPLIYIISCSFSSGDALLAGKVKLFPVEPTLQGYRTVFAYKPIWSGYINSLLYMITGTVIGVALTIMAAYPLSRKDLKGRSLFMGYFVFTMMFSGGLIPSYLLIKQLNIDDSIWAIVLPAAVSAYNVIVVRSFYSQTIPDEMLEASRIDGCNDLKFLLKIVIPLSKPIIAVIGLWIAVSLWNSYFNALIYLDSESKFPLQLVLRGVLVMNQMDISNAITDPEMRHNLLQMSEMFKYGTIIVSSLPLMILYPFIQKYFEKGVMLGSIKG